MVDLSKVELLACPFCGENEIVRTDVWSGFHAKWVDTQECKCCGAAAPVEVWAQRYSDTARQPEDYVPATMKLPCEVKLPGGMTIGIGCRLSTLLLALKQREDGPLWRQRFGEPLPFDPALHKLIGDAASHISQATPQPEQVKPFEALQHAVAYLSRSPLESIHSGSALHKLMVAALATQGGADV